MILVLGATGELGSQVVRALREAGAQVRCLVRKGSPYFWLNDTGAAYFFGDLRDHASLRRACDGVEALVSCAGPRTEGRRSTHDEVTVRGHAALWEAAQASGARRAVYVSCLGASRAPESAAHGARAAAEAALQATGMEHCVLQPSLLASSLISAARFARARGWVPMLGSGDNLVSPIGLRDLALAAVACLDLPAARGAVLEMGGAEALTYREALRRALVAVGASGARLVSPPAVALPALGRLHPRWAHRLDELRVHATRDLSVPPNRFEQLFGWAPAELDRALDQLLSIPPHPKDIPSLYGEITHRAPQAEPYRPS